VKPSAFTLLRPTGLDATLAALADDNATPIAGGQSLLVLLRLRLTAAHTLVDLTNAGLAHTTETPASVLFGAATTHAMIEDGRVPDPSLGLMPRVAAGIAYRAIRNVGTIGGSLALADPAADWPLCLLALNATIHTACPTGRRQIAIDDVLDTAFTTRLAPGELITAIEVPRLPPGTRWGYQKLARQRGAFADSLAIAIQPPNSPPRIALGATSRRPHILPDITAAAIALADPDADPHKARCHLATAQRALAQLQIT
jgi:carbon-monoxide dehydrogenase medium subunit